MSLHFRPEASKAQTVERHNELLRRVLHSVSAQLAEDGVGISPRCIVAKNVFAKNGMLSIQGDSSYQELPGRQPPTLLDFEPADATALADAVNCEPGVGCHTHRLRYNVAGLTAAAQGQPQSPGTCP